MESFPAFFPLRGQIIVIAGEGEPADAKTRLFDGSPAQIRRVTGEAAMLAASYAGARLVFVASWDADFRRRGAAAARAAGVLVNVTDDPELCDFHTPAIIDRGQLVAAIGTGGASPLLAALLRGQVEALAPEGMGSIAALLGSRRAAVSVAFPDLAERRRFLRSVLGGPATRAAESGDMAAAGALLDAAITAGAAGSGRVTFIPEIAIPDLVPLRAARALDMADLVVAGPDAETFLASHGRRDAERLDDIAGADLIAKVAAGLLVAVVGVRATAELQGLAAAAQAPCERLGAASAE